MVNYHLTVPAFRQFWHGVNEHRLKVHFHHIFDSACLSILQTHSAILEDTPMYFPQTLQSTADACTCTLQQCRHLCSKGVCCPGRKVPFCEVL